MKQRKSNTRSNRLDVIQTVKTPLGFFTLAVLVVEVILGISANFSQGTDRTYLIIGMLGLIFLLVIIVAGLAIFRPEALSGKRPLQDNISKTELVPVEDQNITPLQKIAKYRELIEQETKNNLLMNFNVPDGYTPEISTINKFIFGFCYPKDWVFTRLAEQTQYGVAVDIQSADNIGFGRNVNVVIDDISKNTSDLSAIYERALQQVMLIFPKAKLIFKDQDFIFQGLPALRHRVDWLPQTEEKQVVSLYQIH
ncbi:MAG: hypothetical protein KAU38_15750 [Desulfobacterales bacterium]|nr:hypothetical protein [Desulfobacterales bacterium]